MNAALARGFSDSVDDSQRVFRSLLSAFASPGSLHEIRLSCDAPAPLTATSTAAMLALLDCDTSLWLSPEFKQAGVTAFLTFHCAVPMTDDSRAARFCMLSARDADLALFHPGDLEYPERSATLLIQCSELAANSGMRLSGPGIAGERRLKVAGLPETFWRQWRDNTESFPCGVDVVFASAMHIAVLPRTTRAEL